MDRKTMIRVSICFLGSILVIIFLQLLAVGPNANKNYFIRVFPPHFLRNLKSLSLNKNSEYYIAGAAGKFIYLGNYTNPSDFNIVDKDFLNIKFFQLRFPNKTIINSSSLHISIDFPYIFVNNYLSGEVMKAQITDSFPLLTHFFKSRISTSIFLPSSVDAFAIRTYDGKQQQNVLGKLTPYSVYPRLWPQILEKQGEGIFSTDGMLRHDSSTGRFIYVYFYRNRFICLDSNFNIIYHGQTLDTNAHAKIRVATIASDQSTTIASPGFRVSRAACISSEWIFINSDLQADNEEENILKTYIVIDVYGLKNGHYHFSFYLPKAAGKVSDMIFLDSTLITIQGHSLNFYTLNMQEIKK